MPTDVYLYPSLQPKVTGALQPLRAMQAVQPSADEIGKQFAAQYYQTLQTSRPAIRNFYHFPVINCPQEQARMIYEGDEVVGRENIAQKLQNIKCNTLQFALSSVDAQPCGNAILILVCGQLQVGFCLDE
ncbi:nuclear transport factor 2 domain protein [Opisthorchis viverrini]|uniref:Nuclear transport factor 2 n=1 Tax=Opisthorchis viverrini TaxID=6198 RepID=A0A1S8X2R2_OPIVI|nr:nuclear transport factor 2 domain protein [Opisthorchis viverrini]